MKKALLTAHMAYAIWQYNQDNLRLLMEQGYQTHVAASFDAVQSGNITLERTYEIRRGLEDMGVIVHDIPFARSPLKIRNIAAYRALKALIRREHFSLIHTQTPVGGALTRLAARKARRSGTRVIYTAHGFHFFVGAPTINWLVYYRVERWLSRYTDDMIVMNTEDEVAACSFGSACVMKVPGVGVDLTRFRALPAPQGGFILGFVGELNRNKNQSLLIRALAQVHAFAPEARLILTGSGELEGELRALASSLNVKDAVGFTGYRTDVEAVLAGMDIVVSASLREGLPVNVIEAMAAGRPVVVSDIRGHRDLVRNGETGFLYPPGDLEALVDALRCLYRDAELRVRMGQGARESVLTYDISAVNAIMRRVYAGR